MKKAFVNKILILSVIALAGAALEARAQTVNGSIGNGTIKRGGSERAVIIMDIPAELHVNSNRPNSEYSIPTTIKISGTGIRLSRINFPRGKNRKFEFSDNPVNVYEGRVAFPFTVTVPANFKGNTVRVRAVVRYQACTEEVCYPPKNKDITLTARVQ